MTQQQRILALLIERGPVGVSAREAIYDLHITRLAAIVERLRKEGFRIRTEQAQGQTARYVLDGGPTVKAPPRLCTCGHRAHHHVSGMRCMVTEYTPGTYDAGVDCQCQKFTEATG